jgi:titin
MPERQSRFARLGLERLEAREVPTARALASLAQPADAVQASPPTVPQSFTATALSGSLVRLNWADTANETGYRVYQWTGTAWVNSGAVGANVTTFLAGNLSAGRTYYFYVEAFNNLGSAAADWISVTTAAPPTTPGSLTATALSGTQVRLNWADSSGEDGYHVFQWTGNSWMNVGSLGANATSFVASGLTPGRTYYFYVDAYNAAGASAAHFVSAMTASPPAAPSYFSAVPLSGTQVSLSWTDTTGEVGYRVYQWSGSAWTLTAVTGANVTSYLVSGLQANRNYYFYVEAYNAVGGSATNWLSVHTGA